MHKRWVFVLLVAACGDNHNEPPIAEQPDAAVPLAATCDETKLVDTLRAVPHVTTILEQDCGEYVMDPKVRCFGMRVEQPIQHTNPAGPKFQQHLFLMHRGCDRPTLLADWGYSNEFFFDDELSVLYRANALWIEHRYQGESVPATAEWDWTALTIKNGAADMHAIVEGFRKHYGENFVSTGASKGGITSTYHHYLYPKDLDGAIPYVAPASRSPIDAAYQTYLTSSFPPCAQTLRAAQVAALTTRRTMMLQKLSAVQPGFETLMLEQMTASFDWAFWQYYGVQFCSYVPTAASTDTAFFNFFYQFSGFGEISAPKAPGADEEKSWGALYYEWLTEQGFALQLGAHVKPYVAEPSTLATMEDNFHEMFPAVLLPAYDGTVTHAARAWARDSAENLLMIYGQYDPWSGGAMDAPTKATSARFFVPAATHGAQLLKLIPSERAAALAHATRMFGVEPEMPMAPMASAAATNRAAILAGKMRHVTTQLTLRRD
ncbi:MAG: hypothetical protein M4D80_31075 [Myxococcota bacterium]|nr:hypothetical protein [Myxococcota bacterium]